LNCTTTEKDLVGLRPHPMFGTLDSAVLMFDEGSKRPWAIAALTQAIIVKLHRPQPAQLSWRCTGAPDRRKQMARARYGIDGKLIDFGKEAECPCTQLIPELRNCG